MAAPRSFGQARFRRPDGATELWFVRHGESEAYVEGKPVPLLDGQDDPPLSPRGHEQADLVAKRLADSGIDAIYVSCLRRTQQTAAPLAGILGLEPVVDADLREVFLGEWEGGPFRQKMTDGDPVALAMRLEERWDVVPGAEHSADFRARVSAAIERIASVHPNRRVAVFAHGGTIGTALSIATSSRPFAFISCDNASISRLVVAGPRWIVRGFNDTAHFDDAR